MLIENQLIQDSESNKHSVVRARLYSRCPTENPPRKVRGLTWVLLANAHVTHMEDDSPSTTTLY